MIYYVHTYYIQARVVIIEPSGEENNRLRETHVTVPCTHAAGGAVHETDVTSGARLNVPRGRTADLAERPAIGGDGGGGGGGTVTEVVRPSDRPTGDNSAQ